MKIDALHALADIIDACDRTHEMVVTEAIANAIDAGAGMVRVDLDGRNRTITFHNDGPSMGGREFNDYVMPGRPKGVGHRVRMGGGKGVLGCVEQDRHTYGDDRRPCPLVSEMYVDDNALSGGTRSRASAGAGCCTG